MAFGGPAQVLELVQAKRPMLAIDKDEIEVELPENVDDPWGWERKVVAVSLASGTHGGFDSVGSLHRMSSSVRRQRSDRSIISVFGPSAAAELCTRRSQSSKTRCKAPNGQRPSCVASGHLGVTIHRSRSTRATVLELPTRSQRRRDLLGRY